MSAATKTIKEAFEGPVAAVLRKYHLLDEATGDLRVVEVRANPDDENSENISTPIISPDVLQRFLALDPSRSKRVFDWIMYAAGGGKDAQDASRTALEMAHNWVINNRTGDIDPQGIDKAYSLNPEAFEAFARSKGLASFQELRRKRIPFGLNREEEPIDPMSREEAEQDWKANSEPSYMEAYNFADQDLAADPTYPVFGYYVEWPGRKGIYETVEKAVKGFNAILADKKKLSQYNKIKPTAPFQTTLWDQKGQPLFTSAEGLLAAVSQFSRVFAEHRARSNKLYYGRAKEPETGFAKSADAVLYEDDVLIASAPATAGAARHDPKNPKSGRLNWCISNHSRWDSYFSGGGDQFMWSTYAQHGPFVFVKFKPQLEDERLQQVALHLKYAKNPSGKLNPDEIEVWDGENRSAYRYSDILQRLQAESNPGLLRSFGMAVNAAKEWFSKLKPCDIELNPSLESKALARKLVDMMLA